MNMENEAILLSMRSGKSAFMFSLLTKMMQVIDQMISENIGDRTLKAPSVSYGSTNLYMRGPLEEMTRPNLQKVSLDFDSLLFCRCTNLYGVSSTRMKEEYCYSFHDPQASFPCADSLSQHEMPLIIKSVLGVNASYIEARQ